MTLQALEILNECSVANLARHSLALPQPRFARSLERVFDELAPAHHVRGLPAIPLLLVYGGRDAVAPCAHGERLLARAKGPTAWYCVRAASHVTLIFSDECAQRVAQWFGQVLEMGEENRRRGAVDETVGHAERQGGACASTRPAGTADAVRRAG
jgi:hypothetical protein